MAWRLAFLLQGGKSAAITCRIDRCLGDRDLNDPALGIRATGAPGIARMASRS
jgi:hypothetical protein